MADFFMMKFFGPCGRLSKPRIRPLNPLLRDNKWLCVGSGLYSYGDTAEQAYTRWRDRVLMRRMHK